MHQHSNARGPRRTPGHGRREVRPEQLPGSVRTMQPGQGQGGVATRATAQARVLVVIDWLPLFMPALVLLTFLAAVSPPAQLVIEFAAAAAR
jgi:hypothetical protein